MILFRRLRAWRARRAQASRMASAARVNRLLTRALDWHLESLLLTASDPRLRQLATLTTERGGQTKGLERSVLRILCWADRWLPRILGSHRWERIKGRLLGHLLLSAASSFRRSCWKRWGVKPR
jgi:hypothetical protein